MYKRRIKIVLLIIGLVFTGILGRLYHLQIVQGQALRASAEKSLLRPDVLPAMRGQITDRAGRLLAIDLPCYDFCLDYGFLVSDKGWIKRRKAEIKRSASRTLTAEEVDALYNERSLATWRVTEDIAREQGDDLSSMVQRIVGRVETISRRVGMSVVEQTQTHPIAAGLDEAEAVAIRARLDDTVGAAVVPSCKRWYPYGPIGCHFIGLVRQVDAEDQRRHNIPSDEADALTRERYNYTDGDVIGKQGVEKLCEPLLRGTRG